MSGGERKTKRPPRRNRLTTNKARRQADFTKPGGKPPAAPRVLLTAIKNPASKPLGHALADAGFILSAITDDKHTLPEYMRPISPPDTPGEWAQTINTANFVVHFNAGASEEATEILNALAEARIRGIVLVHPIESPHKTPALPEKSPTALLKTPPLYGPRPDPVFHFPLKAASRGLSLPLGRLTFRRDALYVRNLAEIIAYMLSSTSLPTGSFSVRDAETPNVVDFYRALAKAFSKKAFCPPCPPGLLSCLAGLGPDSPRLRTWLTPLEVTPDVPMDWTPRHRQADGLAHMADWFLEEGEVIRG